MCNCAILLLLLLQGEGEEEETDDLIGQVLDEIGINTTTQVRARRLNLAMVLLADHHDHATIQVIVFTHSIHSIGPMPLRSGRKRLHVTSSALIGVEC
jgi:hypothetical protein